MAETINVTIRLDRDIKERAEALFNDLGMNLSTAYNMFTRQALRERRIPFEISADPFWSEANQAELNRRIAEIEAGIANLTIHELIEVDDE